MRAGRDAGRAVLGNSWDILDGIEPERLASVSVIVSHYRQPEQLARMIVALDRQDYPAGLVEVIVVDDGSPEPPTVPEHVRLLTQGDEGFRLAAARNRGAEAATNDVVVFLDADTAPEPDYLRRITRLPALSWDAVTVGHRRHAELAGVPPEIPVEQAGRQHELPEPGWLLHGYRDSRNLLRADHRSYRYVIGAVIACSRRFFAETGGFDENFTSYGGEDWEWGYRAWLHGAVLCHVPDAVAWHDGPDRPAREPDGIAAKNAETLRLADLIPVPGSRARALPSARVDVRVSGPSPESTVGQTFLSVDSVIAELRNAEPASPEAADDVRFDRVRLDLVIERPVRVLPGGLAAAVAAIESGSYAEVVIHAPDDGALLRLVSRREAARQRRWGAVARLPTLHLQADGVEPANSEVSLEGYLGGWS